MEVRGRERKVEHRCMRFACCKIINTITTSGQQAAAFVRKLHWTLLQVRAAGAHRHCRAQRDARLVEAQQVLSNDASIPANVCQVYVYSGSVRLLSGNQRDRLQLRACKCTPDERILLPQTATHPRPKTSAIDSCW